MQNLLQFDQAQLAELMVSLGEKPFRAKQLMYWIHQRGESDFQRMTDIAQSTRARLAAHFIVAPPRLISERISLDGTRKWLFDIGAAGAVETVYIPERNRRTLCISSQAGCALECLFCSTGRQGFNRNLTVEEIIGQLWWACRALRESGSLSERPITNVVMMGMGEPLANYTAVVSALRLMLDDHAYGLSRRRVTLSTAGMVPALDRLKEDCPVALAVSLHAPTDTLRDTLVPLNRKYPLSTLLSACNRYLEKAPRDFVTFEYVMLSDVNDSLAQAHQLIALTRSIHCKFNLIPFNSFPKAGLRGSSVEQIRQFAQVLTEAGVVATVRKTRGDDIEGACGQLAGQVNDKTSRQLKWQRMEGPLPLVLP